MSLRDSVQQAFHERFGREPEIIVRAPGRVNLLGAHVDYNEGWVLPAATEQAVWLAADPAGNEVMTIKALDFDGEERQFSPSELAPRNQREPVTWADYPRAVAWALACEGHRVTPMDAVFAGDVPIGAGVSSSAAVEVAFLTAWNGLDGLNLTGVTLARLGQMAENQYIGLASGIMDQFASIHGAEGHLVLLDCRTLEHELVPLPESCSILVADSGVRRELAGSEYNVRRSQCDEAVSILANYLPGVRALRDVSPRALELNAHYLPVVLRRRAQHVVNECQRVLEGAACLKQGHVAAFGRLIEESHMSARDLYEVSIPELDLLAATAWQVDGCYGARLTGAGFGGCIVILAESDAEPRLRLALEEVYQRTFERTPRIFSTQAADGTRIVGS